jgi:hypothetical protein
MRSPVHTLGMVAWSKQVKLTLSTPVIDNLKYQVGGGGPTGTIVHSGRHYRRIAHCIACAVHSSAATSKSSLCRLHRCNVLQPHRLVTRARFHCSSVSLHQQLVFRCENFAAKNFVEQQTGLVRSLFVEGARLHGVSSTSTVISCRVERSLSGFFSRINILLLRLAEPERVRVHSTQ